MHLFGNTGSYNVEYLILNYILYLRISQEQQIHKIQHVKLILTKKKKKKKYI